MSIGPIGKVEFRNKYSSDRTLGVSSTTDQGLLRVVGGSNGSLTRIEGFTVVNVLDGDVTITVKKRGTSFPITAEDIEALQVGATDQFKGPLANRRVTPGTVVITDANGGTPQKVEDTNGDGRLFQTDGPAGPVYPQEIGTIEYNNGKIDFTFLLTVTLTTVEAAYTHTDWTAFGTPITFTVVKGGGTREFKIYPDNAENWVDGVKGQEEVGFFGKLASASDANSMVVIDIGYFGDDSLVQMPFQKGEINDFPLHNN